LKAHLAPIAIAVLAVSAVASAADPAGYIKHNGKKIAVTAVYFHHEANTDVIVFDDSARATKAIEKKSQSGYAMTDDGISADTVFYDLANKGGHPIELTIMDDDEHTVTDLSMLESRNKSATHFSPSSARVEIVRQDGDRIEGTATYDDGKTTMSLPFAIDRNRVGHAKAPGANMPPPPPPPPAPPPSNPVAMLMMAADLLELEIGDYYKQHGNTWPTSIVQVDKQPWESPDPVAARKLGPNGVLTIVFAPDAPYVGGKTVAFTPTVKPDGIEWHCSTKDAMEACQ
jgi:hypothetical protein